MNTCIQHRVYLAHMGTHISKVQKIHTHSHIGTVTHIHMDTLTHMERATHTDTHPGKVTHMDALTQGIEPAWSVCMCCTHNSH